MHAKTSRNRFREPVSSLLRRVELVDVSDHGVWQVGPERIPRGPIGLRQPFDRRPVGRQPLDEWGCEPRPPAWTPSVGRPDYRPGCSGLCYGHLFCSPTSELTSPPQLADYTTYHVRRLAEHGAASGIGPLAALHVLCDRPWLTGVVGTSSHRSGSTTGGDTCPMVCLGRPWYPVGRPALPITGL